MVRGLVRWWCGDGASERVVWLGASEMVVWWGGQDIFLPYFVIYYYPPLINTRYLFKCLLRVPLKMISFHRLCVQARRWWSVTGLSDLGPGVTGPCVHAGMMLISRWSLWSRSRCNWSLCVCRRDTGLSDLGSGVTDTCVCAGVMLVMSLLVSLF